MTALGNPWAGMLDINGVPIPDDRPEELQLTLPMLEAEAKERMLAGKPVDPSPQTDEGPGRATAKAAEMVGVGRTSIEHAKAAA